MRVVVLLIGPGAGELNDPVPGALTQHDQMMSNELASIVGIQTARRRAAAARLCEARAEYRLGLLPLTACRSTSSLPRHSAVICHTLTFVGRGGFLDILKNEGKRPTMSDVRGEVAEWPKATVC